MQVVMDPEQYGFDPVLFLLLLAGAKDVQPRLKELDKPRSQYFSSMLSIPCRKVAFVTQNAANAKQLLACISLWLSSNKSKLLHPSA